MLRALSIPACLLAAFAVALPGYGEISSQNHPSLQRAFTESPQADKDANGSLSLAEDAELLKQKRPHDPENPKAPLLPVRDNGDLVIHEFEDNNIMQAPKWSPVQHHALKGHSQGWHVGGPWVREGTAFNRDLTSSTKLMKRRVGPYNGKFFVTTVSEGEAATGRLVSPVFLIEQDFIVLTVSGGGFPNRVCANLHLGEGIVRSVTGRNDDYFEEVAFDVREFNGQLAKIELLDNHRGLWGYLNVDEILMVSQAGDARIVVERPAPVVSTEGVVVTSTGPQAGPLKMDNGRLTSGSKSVDDPVLLAINAEGQKAEPLRGAVRLLNGEVWRADVGNVEGAGRAKTLSINSRTFGPRKVPLSALASMEFVAARASEPQEPETLYRSEGEPIPGTLIWVRAKDIAIRSPLGILPVPRAAVHRYVLAHPTPPASRQTDEIGLMDGSLIFGKTSFAADQLVVAHEVLGELKLPWNSVRYLRRNLPGLTWLDTLRHTVVESIGPALPPPAPQQLATSEDSHLRTFRIMPHTVVRLPLPSGPHAGATLRAQLATVPGCRADVQVSVLAGETTVWNQRITADSKPLPLSINLSNAEHLTLRVEFAGPLSFPCGIDLRDAHVLTVSNPGTEPKDN